MGALSSVSIEFDVLHAKERKPKMLFLSISYKPNH